MTKGDDLATLVGARICHDLISPIGAIGNGMELLALSGVPPSPELELIEDSLRNAMARVQFFRIAFGAAEAGQVVSRSEILDTLQGAGDSGRTAYDWQVPGNPSRRLVRSAFLILQCLEAAMPRGGTITIASTGCGLNILAVGQDLRIDPALWDRFGQPADNRTMIPSVIPAMVQFALLPQALSDAGQDVSVAFEPDRIKVTVEMNTLCSPDAGPSAKLTSDLAGDIASDLQVEG